MRKLFLLYLLFCFVIPADSQVLNDSLIYRNLVFEGAGVRGIAYAGALQELEKLNVLPRVQRAAGNSAGSIVAALIATGYSGAEIAAFIEKVNMRKLTDGGGLLPGGMRRLKRNYGYYKGERLREIIGEFPVSGSCLKNRKKARNVCARSETLKYHSRLSLLFSNWIDPNNTFLNAIARRKKSISRTERGAEG